MLRTWHSCIGVSFSLRTDAILISIGSGTSDLMPGIIPGIPSIDGTFDINLSIIQTFNTKIVYEIIYICQEKINILYKLFYRIS